jgi:hypothetical protein
VLCTSIMFGNCLEVLDGLVCSSSGTAEWMSGYCLLGLSGGCARALFEDAPARARAKAFQPRQVTSTGDEGLAFRV